MEAPAATSLQPITEVQVPSIVKPVDWHFSSRLAFRFAFVYFAVYSFPFPLYYIPYTDKLWAKFTALWHGVEVWVGKHVLHFGYPITVFENGSGDTTSNYVQVLCFLVLAILATAIWSMLDRKRPEYRRLSPWLRLAVRIFLGAILLSYGASKVIKTQFPQISLSTLVEPYGESSPMGLLWNFMEYSVSYTVFSGAVEMLAGILLFVPRLTTLGALIAAGAMTNVFMLNMSYDVPVKLFSFHLLAFSALLLAPDLKRLANFFLLNRDTGPSTELPFFQRRWLNLTVLIAVLAFGLYSAWGSLRGSYSNAKTYGFLVPKPPLYGVWSVEEFTADGVTRPPLLTDDLRWQRVIFEEYPKIVAFQKMSGERQRFVGEVDLDKKTMKLNARAYPAGKPEFSLDRPEPDVLVLDGQMYGHKIHARLHRDNKKFLLIDRGFHWINEYPFNR